MFTSLDKNGKRVSIDDVIEGETYFCPTCHKDLILKKVSIKIHHFSHPPSSGRSDSWNYDMSEWHKYFTEGKLR